jgi:hypothetical protein
MAIGSAIERGSLIQVFDERGRTLFSKARGSGPKDGLLGCQSVRSRYGVGAPRCSSCISRLRK